VARSGQAGSKAGTAAKAEPPHTGRPFFLHNGGARSPRAVGAARIVPPLALLCAALAVWQGLSASGLLTRAQFPSMTSTLAALGHQLAAASLWTAVGETAAGWALGMLLGCTSAIVIGSILGLNRFAYRSAIPVIEFFKTIPVVAILPIALLLFGATLRMTYVIVAFGVFWPLVIQVIYGVRSIDPTVRDTATVLQVRGVRRFFVITMPSAAPFIATGLRVSAAVALILAIIAELIGGSAGVGQRILDAENSGPGAYPVMYAYILVAGLLGVLFAGLFAVLERRVLHWHESQRNLREAGRG
jgi:ABC-type nitrate/sulfonate/bicarbonate transport system permease component